MTDAYANDTAITSYIMERVPIGRWGTPIELNPAVLFLASPANTFTTGISVAVDGGFCGK
jgi:NAD(P)-dependent dehydrogenase (short-subunit alcohol dehydrogenase family)